MGDIVVPERDYQCGLKRGELYRVTGIPRHDRITVQAVDSSTLKPELIEIIPRTMGKLSIYHLNESELSVGDQVRVTRNDAQHDLVNGQLARVAAIEVNALTVETGGRSITLPTDRPLHLDYAYTTTAHSAQGLTCDRVLYNAESFSRTTAQDTYYVSISRERHEVVVFTDDADKLPERVDRLGFKGLAHDLAQAHVESPAPHLHRPDVTLEREAESSMEIS